MVKKYRKKPVVIEAVLWDGEQKTADMILGWSQKSFTYDSGKKTLDVPTLEGTLTAQAGDYVIKGVEGELYPCKPAIFAKTYEEVTE